MLTRWGEITSKFYWSSSTNCTVLPFQGNPITKAMIPVKDARQGTELYARHYAYNFSTTGIFSIDDTASGVAFGTGTTAPTVDDYKLEHMITSGMTASKSSDVIYDSEHNTIESFVQYTLTNTSASDITVSEIGRFCNVLTSTTKDGTSENRKCILAERIVLSEPITIPAGEAGVVRLSLIFSTVLPE